VKSIVKLGKAGLRHLVLNIAKESIRITLKEAKKCYGVSTVTLVDVIDIDVYHQLLYRIQEKVMTEMQSDEEILNELQRSAFGYFTKTVNPENGLIPDNTSPGSTSSIAAVGLALASYPVGVERGYISREEAVQLILATLRFFWNSPQGPEPDATGYKGFYYHFLDMVSGLRARNSELSSVDTGCLLAGALYARQYFDRDSREEKEIRSLAESLYLRTDWEWMANGEASLTHGWFPESGFLGARWKGYNEGLFLYILGLGSPTHPLSQESYRDWTSTYAWKTVYGLDYLYAGPLFIHQYSHLWIDFQGIRDEFMREKGSDYFENTRLATLVQQQYAIHNPLAYRAYGENFWGLTASEGPGPGFQIVDGIERFFLDYQARGAPFGPDDGSVAPWAVLASLPFAPEIVMPAARRLMKDYPELISAYGCKSTLNPTFLDESGDPRGWISPHHYGLNQGPLVMMVENYRSGLLWNLMRRDPYWVKGLRRAGFRGGWLET
jgi:hypothetical protein